VDMQDKHLLRVHRAGARSLLALLVHKYKH